jgi:dimethylhistidine N-methyltransferase
LQSVVVAMLSSGRALAAVTTGDPVLNEVLAGLVRPSKRLPCKLLYDLRGYDLYERVCGLDDYYLTRAELEVLTKFANEMAARIGPDAVLVEFGSGNSLKTRLLLDALERPRLYVPIDISPAVLAKSKLSLRERYPKLDVRPLAADYTRRLALPLRLDEQHSKLTFLFSGSGIGNLERTEALEFLDRIRHSYGDSQRFIVGVDLPKERHVLESAYDDAGGVTAEFNRNILLVINRMFGADFRPEFFDHYAPYDEVLQRVEMQLVSLRCQTVNIKGHRVNFHEGESIVTEHCYKYPLLDFARLARRAGYDVARVWTDSRQLFSVQWLEAARTARYGSFGTGYLGREVPDRPC